MDIQLLNAHLQALLAGQTIEKPVYSFKEGRRTANKPVWLEDGQVLLLDCLHGLYPPITEGIPPSAQFRVYIETQNVLYEGDGSSGRLTAFTDVRLIRPACCAIPNTATTARCSPSSIGTTCVRAS